VKKERELRSVTRDASKLRFCHTMFLGGTLLVGFLFIASVLSFHNCPNDCSGHGICVLFNFCICNAGFLSFPGSDCSQELTCATDVSTLCPIQDWTCGGIACDDPGVCGGLGTCVAPDECACCPGCIGDNCTDIHAVCDPPCEHGICLFEQGTGETFCSCEPGHTGDACDTALTCGGLAIHHPDVCSGHGTCDLVLSLDNRTQHASHYLLNGTLPPLEPEDLEDHYAGAAVECCCDRHFTGDNCEKKTKEKAYAVLWWISLGLGIGMGVLILLGAAYIVFQYFARRRTNSMDFRPMTDSAMAM